MPKDGTARSAKKRVNVKDLPASEKKLTGKQMKKVKGGVSKTGTGTMILSGNNVRSTKTGDGS